MIHRFFIFCSGADADLLQDCSKGENNKYFGIGATVFFTAIMAAIAGSFALYTVFENLYSSIAFGLIWGLLIFNLDRYIVSTLRKKNSPLQELIQVSPRLFLAIIIAIVISKPLEIKIFEKEIQTVLLKQKNKLALEQKQQVGQYFASDVKKLKTEIDSLKAEVLTKEKEVNALYNTYITEAEGTAGTKKLGKGPVYKEKRDKHDAALNELAELKEKNKKKIIEKENQITKLQATEQQQITQGKPIVNAYDGLMARINALNELPLVPSLFIMLLFLAIETAPIFTKLFSSKSEYDYKFEAQETALKNRIQQENNQNIIHSQSAIAIDTEVYEDIKTDTEIKEYKKQLAIDLLKYQSEKHIEKSKRIS